MLVYAERPDMGVVEIDIDYETIGRTMMIVVAPGAAVSLKAEK